MKTFFNKIRAAGISLLLGVLTIGILLGWGLSRMSRVSDTPHHPHDKTEPGESELSKTWTCSMHPSIRTSEPGNCPLCGMALVPVDTGSDGLASDQFRLTKNAMALAGIQTTVVGKEVVKNVEMRFSGKILENEESNSVQVSYFSGRIESLHVNFTGERVRKGQLLATIYSPELFEAQQELITVSALKETQPALYQAVRNKLKLWKVSESHIDHIESSGRVNEKFPIHATVSGTVSEKMVDEGDYVERGQALLKLSNLNTVWASFDVYEHQIGQIKTGQMITISTRVYPNEEFKARVSFIDPVINPRTRTTHLRAELGNRDGMFKPGMFVEGKIENVVEDSEPALTVPSSAVLWTGKRSLVYLKTNPDEPVFEAREVSTRVVSGDLLVIESGLKAGDEVVTNGIFTVDAAAQLSGKKSMMNR